MATFKIVTAKWKWPPAVANKEVYRDDEFIVSKTKEEALSAAHFLLKKPKGLTYTITVYREGEYFTYYRHSQPCLGALVKYAATHGKEKFFMNPYFPRDIKVSFPEGDIIYIGMCRQGILKDLTNPYYEFILSDESPWKSAFHSRDSILFQKDHFVFTNMEGDPTVFYSLMRLGGLAGGLYNTPTSNWNPKAQILYSKFSQADPRRLAGQRPINISGGPWSAGYGFTRPFNEYIFHTSLPVELKDFGSLSYGPRTTYKSDYFGAVLKKNFGADYRVRDEKLHKAIVESWDFFKAEAEKLKDFEPIEQPKTK